MARRPKRSRLRTSLVTLAVVGAALGGAETSRAALSWSAAPAPQTASSEACDPCTFIWVVRTGAGRVVSDIVTNESVPLDCGPRCQGDFYSWDVVYVTLSATPVDQFAGWTDCPAPSGNLCRVEMDGIFHCVKAQFRTGTEVVGSCPPPGVPPPGPGTGPQTPPPPTGGGLPGSRVRCSVVGGPGPDVLIGTPADNRICGGGGNDRISGGGGDDFLRGGGGNDTIVGGGGRDRLLGEGGKDRLSGGAGNDALHGGAGVDVFAGGAGADLIDARDRLRERVNGGPGRDRVRVDRTDRLTAVERRF
jgi:RTX calcium-binding nonapeptide repeat (4 copies)